MRIPAGTDFQSRDGTLTKDGRITNGFIESNGPQDPFPKVRKRPGMTNRGTITAGTPQMLNSLLGYIYSAIGNNVREGILTAGTYVAGGGPIGLTAGGSIQMTVGSASAANQFLMFKSANQAYYTNNPVLGGGVAGYIGSNYPNNLAPARPTVPGLVFIDGYFVVMDAAARIYNSNLNDPSTWSALGVITAQYETGAGVALAKSQEYIAAFKDYSVELFYNAGNPTASPFSRVDNGFFKVGCAVADSLADIKGQIFFISQSRQKGRSVHVMLGTQNTEVATPDIQRILNADSLATVYAYGARLAGHDLYIVTLTNTGVTLCYDLDEKKWYRLTSMVLGSAIAYSTLSLTNTGGVATWISDVAHGMSDGDAVLISGATQPEYNGIFQINYINANSFSYYISGTPASPATGTVVGKPYTETYFKYVMYANYSGYDLFLHESTGVLYSAEQTINQDDGVPINYDIRTQKIDGGTLDFKFMGAVRLPGNEVSDIAMVRWTDDDYQTYNAYRKIDLSIDYPEIRRCGKFRRRAFEIRHIGNTAPIYDAIEMDLNNG